MPHPDARTLENIKRTERNLLVVQVALRRLLEDESALFRTPQQLPVLTCWTKSHLTSIGRLIRQERARLQALIDAADKIPTPPTGAHPQ